MFLMKFVTKFPMVFEYPFALLAYPSGTFEFYLALLVILFIYRNEYKKTKDKGSFHYDMFLLAAGSSFFYYFTIITLYSEDVFIEIGLWFFLFVSSVIFKKYWHEILLVGIATASVLSIVVEVPAIMGIRVHMAFYLLLTMLLFILLIKKWRGSKWAQT
ncbi:hypothetical protein [Halobacillus sp. BBL2006]|uniref:hypothetical protein n=1 Tax=Halobacillus sp. BBL2006 TaxID=1543706 RepID=UPI0012E03831|nr:hypothetical protein [Halobacillus sp. BBL2006]